MGMLYLPIAIDHSSKAFKKPLEEKHVTWARFGKKVDKNATFQALSSILTPSPKVPRKGIHAVDCRADPLPVALLSCFPQGELLNLENMTSGCSNNMQWAEIKFDKGSMTLKAGRYKIGLVRTLEFPSKIEERIERDLDPMIPTNYVSRRILEWEERIEKRQKDEMRFSKGRSKYTLRGLVFCLILPYNVVALTEYYIDGRVADKIGLAARELVTSQEDENSNRPRTLGDYSRPRHEGYRNAIKLLEGAKVSPLRSDTIRLVQNGCAFHELMFEYPIQHLKDFLKIVDFNDLKVPHHGLDLWLQVQIFYDHVDYATQMAIDYAAGGRLRKLRAEVAWESINNLAQCEGEWWNDPIFPNKGIPDYIDANLEKELESMDC
ncbi:hypothetical protein Tco_0998131 [Tanacetum coccineum]